jgi:anti-sigma regulatory factor (Ser/Thr protein kinase)
MTQVLARGNVGAMEPGERAPADAGAQRLFADAGAPRRARHLVAGWLHDHGARPEVVEDLSLAVSELVANVVQHGDTPDVWIRVDDGDAEWWTVEVSERRRALPTELTDPSAWNIAGPDSRNGRGLGIVRTVVDHLDVFAGDGTVTIRCCQRRV